MTQFDTSKYLLGRLCTNNHDHAGLGRTLRYISNGACVICTREKVKRYHNGTSKPRRPIGEFEEGVHTLGDLCRHKHEYRGSGKTLRYLSNGSCVTCTKAQKARHVAKRAEGSTKPATTTWAGARPSTPPSPNTVLGLLVERCGEMTVAQLAQLFSITAQQLLGFVIQGTLERRRSRQSTTRVRADVTSDDDVEPAPADALSETYVTTTEVAKALPAAHTPSHSPSVTALVQVRQLEASTIDRRPLGGREVLPELRAYMKIVEHEADSDDGGVVAQPLVRIRSRTEAVNRMRKTGMQIGRFLWPEHVVRPRTRADCINGIRPCPHVACRHNLYLDVNDQTGSIKFNFPELEAWEMPPDGSCALDVAARGGCTLDRVGQLVNITRERTRQVEEKAFKKIQESDPEIAEYLQREPDAWSARKGHSVVQ